MFFLLSMVAYTFSLMFSKEICLKYIYCGLQLLCDVHVRFLCVLRHRIVVCHKVYIYMDLNGICGEFC